VLDLQPPGYRRFGGISGRQAAQSLLVGELTPSRRNQFDTQELKVRSRREGNRGMPSSDDYRRHATECVRLTQNAQNPADKALLLKMAETWLRLAEQAEGRESKKPA
jgi:hypothetical protein